MNPLEIAVIYTYFILMTLLSMTITPLFIFAFITEALEAERKKASQTDSVESYEAAFERIKEITGEDDMDLLVQRFIECEDKNFALFNYVNEQNNDMELLSEQIQDVSTHPNFSEKYQVNQSSPSSLLFIKK